MVPANGPQRIRAAAALAFKQKAYSLTSFEGFGLDEAIVRAIAEENYATPTPVQEQTIPTAMSRRDVIGIAQTGTGKTAAFALPILHHLVTSALPPERKGCRTLVLCPTRELSGQVLNSFRTYGRHLRIRTALAILAGGVLLEEFSQHIGPHWIIVILAVALGVLATVLAVIAYVRWRANEIAMRNGSRLPLTIAVPLIAAVVLAVGAVLTVLIAIYRP